MDKSVKAKSVMSDCYIILFFCKSYHLHDLLEHAENKELA